MSESEQTRVLRAATDRIDELYPKFPPSKPPRFLAVETRAAIYNMVELSRRLDALEAKLPMPIAWGTPDHVFQVVQAKPTITRKEMEAIANKNVQHGYVLGLGGAKFISAEQSIEAIEQFAALVGVEIT